MSGGNGEFTGIASYYNKYANQKHSKASFENIEEILERLSYHYTKATMEAF